MPEEDDFEEEPSVCGDGVKAFDEQCDDGNLADGDSCSSTCLTVEQFVVHWETKSISTGTHSCPAGFDRAEVITEPVKLEDSGCYPYGDCAYTSDGPKATFPEACADGAARIQLPTKKLYRVSVAFANSTTGDRYGETLATWLDEVTHLTMYEDQGFVHVAWKFHSTQWGDLDCFNANVPEVTINLKRDGFVAATTTVPCMKLQALTPPAVHGAYDVEVVTSQGSTTVPDVTIEARSALTELDTVTVPVP